METQLSFDTKLPPIVTLCIPPVLREQAESIASEQPPIHPVWSKLAQRGRHFSIRTNDLEDVTELADWAHSALVEPEAPLSKTQRQAFQAVLDRASRYAECLSIGECHCIALRWRDKPLSSSHHFVISKTNQRWS
jgi:hypothetical protein